MTKEKRDQLLRMVAQLDGLFAAEIAAFAGLIAYHAEHFHVLLDTQPGRNRRSSTDRPAAERHQAGARWRCRHIRAAFRGGPALGDRGIRLRSHMDWFAISPESNYRKLRFRKTRLLWSTGVSK
jgi:hypothetical protein